MRALISFAVLYAHAFIPTNLYQRYRNGFALFQQPNESINGSISSNSYYQRPIQKRSSPRRPRKPKLFWKNPENIRKELHLFWKELGINNSDDQLYLPNEHMLNYFKRNDLRAAIYQIGGRESLAHMLDAQVIPGKWIDAVELDIVKQVLPLMEEKKSNSTESKTRQPKQSNIAPASTKGFWSKETAIKELYIYLETYRNHNQRPAVYMPQLSELKPSKLFNALSRFKKLPSTSMVVEDDINSAAGLIKYKEWSYFESQLSLLTELEIYLQSYHNSSEQIFPEPTDILENGHNNMNDLIRIHGGKVLLADKFDMKLSSGISSRYSYGRFSVRFAVQLLVFIRNQYLLLDPPLQCTHISMPTENDLIRSGHKDLADQVLEYGGYESVARRLGLEFFDGLSDGMENERFEKAKLLSKERHNDEVVSSVKKRKTDGVAWDEELVVTEL